MKQQSDSKGELRAAFTLREIKNAKRSCQTSTAGTFVRVTLAVIFIYLIAISHQMFGAVGPVFVSILFVVALLVPVLYHAANAFLDQRRAKAKQSTSGKIAEVQQPG